MSPTWSATNSLPNVPSSLRYPRAGRRWGRSCASTCPRSIATIPAHGCPNAALLEEIGRCGDGVRDSYTRGMQSIVEVIATHLSPEDPFAARSIALGLFTILVATMQLARAVSDRELSDDILESGISNAQLLLGYEQPETDVERIVT